MQSCRFQLQATQYSYAALATLESCLLAPPATMPCCSSTAVVPSPMYSCSITTGPLGEYINNYPGHPALGNTNTFSLRLKEYGHDPITRCPVH